MAAGYSGTREFQKDAEPPMLPTVELKTGCQKTINTLKNIFRVKNPVEVIVNDSDGEAKPCVEISVVPLFFF